MAFRWAGAAVLEPGSGDGEVLEFDDGGGVHE